MKSQANGIASRNMAPSGRKSKHGHVSRPNPFAAGTAVRHGGDDSSPVRPPLRQPCRSAGLQPALVVRTRRVNATGQIVGRPKPVSQSAGLRPPQQTPSQSKPENGFDFPLPLACCGSQSRAPGLHRGRPVPHQAGCQLHPSSLMIHPFPPGNPLPARRADILAASPSQNQFKLRRSGIALPRTDQYPQGPAATRGKPTPPMMDRRQKGICKYQDPFTPAFGSRLTRWPGIHGQPISGPRPDKCNRKIAPGSWKKVGRVSNSTPLTSDSVVPSGLEGFGERQPRLKPRAIVGRRLATRQLCQQSKPGNAR
jgi:hypothetical protein